MGERRKKLVILLFLCAFLALLSFLFYKGVQSKREKETDILKIGISIYKGTDTFISNIMTNMKEAVKDFEIRYPVRIQLDISDANENQKEQDKQIERYIALDYDIICVNLVDRTTAATIVDKMNAAELPLIFFNREPVEEDIFRGDNIYYVGSSAEETAELQGKIIADLYKKTPEELDLNGNGTIEYVMLEGEMGHQDAIIRTEGSVKILKELGIPIKEITSGVANFERSQAGALMEEWLETYDNQIELVICNNDDMALGACDALEKIRNTAVKVVGIDGTTEGLKAVEDKKMSGTVSVNTKKQAEAIVRLAYSIVVNGKADETLDIEEERYVRVDLETVTAD